MNRRGFLKLLGMAPIAAVAGPALGSGWLERSPLETVKALKAFYRVHWRDEGFEGFAVGRNVYASYYQWLADAEYGQPGHRGGRFGFDYTKFQRIGIETYEMCLGKPFVMDPALPANAITMREWPEPRK